MAVTADSLPRGSIVLVRCPRDKARPAVVIRSDMMAGLSHATLLPLTSDLYPDVEFRVDVAPSQENGLREPSQIMADWPQTVFTSEIGAVIGRLDARTLQTVTNELANMLGIGGRAKRSAAHP